LKNDHLEAQEVMMKCEEVKVNFCGTSSVLENLILILIM